MTLAFDGEKTPTYTVGDRVLIVNPIDFFEIDDMTVRVVTDVKFSEAHGVFVYRLDGGLTWINEAWLEPDIFGPQYVEDNTEHERKLLLLEQDYLLASLSDAISTQDTETIAKDKARLAEISTELEAL